MACKLVSGKGFVGFQCSHIGEFRYLENERNLEPYEEHECAHEKRFEHKGQLRCQQCSAVYDENLQAWVVEL